MVEFEGLTQIPRSKPILYGVRIMTTASFRTQTTHSEVRFEKNHYTSMLEKFMVQKQPCVWYICELLRETRSLKL